MTSELELQHLSDIADAKLEVAEDFGWVIAVLLAIMIYLKWDTWFWAIIALIAGYFIATYKYRKDSVRAEDEYFRAASLGKYSGLK